MSEEETLALDAMRGDNIIDIEQRQTYLALTEALEGDYMSGEERGPGRIDVGPLPEGYKETFQYGGGVGVVGATPTSEPQKLLNELQGIINAHQQDIGNVPFNRALDILHELSELFLNQK